MVCFISWIAVALLSDQHNVASLAADALLFSTLLVCWVGAIFIWSKSTSSGVLHLLSLAVLVIFGYLVGWVYVLFRADVLRERQEKEQKAIDERGGVKDLDNKRNEIPPKKQKESL